MDDTATLQQLVRKVDALTEDSHLQNETLTRLNLTSTRLLKLLDGDPAEDILGLRPRVRELEKQVATVPVDLVTQITDLRKDVLSLKDEAAAWKNRYLGAKWVLTFLGLTNAATIIAVLRLLFGAH